MSGQYYAMRLNAAVRSLIVILEIRACSSRLRPRSVCRNHAIRCRGAASRGHSKAHVMLMPCHCCLLGAEDVHALAVDGVSCEPAVTRPVVPLPIPKPSERVVDVGAASLLFNK